jgi:hypothetical protein
MGTVKFLKQLCKAGDGIAGPRSPGDTITGFTGVGGRAYITGHLFRRANDL